MSFSFGAWVPYSNGSRSYSLLMIRQLNLGVGSFLALKISLFALGERVKLFRGSDI